MRATELTHLANPLIVLLAAAIPARAQCEPQWLPGEGLPGTDGTIYATAMWDPDGAGPQSPLLIVGGYFKVAGDVSAKFIAAWDGTEWQALGTGMGYTAYALTVYEGQLIAGGSFTIADGIPANHIARWDGATWQALAIGTNDAVRALATYNGDLIAGGEFSTAGGVSAKCIAKWNGVAWQALGAGMASGSGGTAVVYALTLHDGGLIAGGEFTTAGGVSANNIARFDNGAWQPFGAGIGGYGNPVYALAAYNGDLIAGGDFMCHIRRWDGTSWEPLGLGLNDTAHSLNVSAGKLFAGGEFTTAGEATASHIACWNGSSWEPLGAGADGRVWALTSLEDSLIAGGELSAAGGAVSSHIAVWDGADWSALGTGLGVNDDVNALVTFESNLIAGGRFTIAGQTEAAHVARWNGVEWQALGSGVIRTVHAVAVHDGELFVGGQYLTFAGIPHAVLRWDGAEWQPLGTIPFSGFVRALTAYGSDVIAGGCSFVVSGVFGDALAKWNGGTWQQVGTVGLYGEVLALAQYNGALIVGGDFHIGLGGPSVAVASWDGTNWDPIGISINYAEAYALAVYNDELIAGGAFNTLGDIPAHNVARWNGAVWQPCSAGTNGLVLALTVHDSELIAGGAFTIADGLPTNRVARWDGAIWRPLGTGLNDWVRAVQSYNDELIAGGSFVASGENISPHLARWRCLGIAASNPPISSPFGIGVFRDVLQNTTPALTPQGIGVSGTPDEGEVTYATVNVTFNGTPSPAPAIDNISVSCTDASGNGSLDCPAVTAVTGSGVGPYAITLSAPPPPGECITLTFPDTATGQKLQYQVLPGDVNLDGLVSTQDLLFLIQHVQDGLANAPANRARFNINRSTESNNAVNTQDILREVQLLNGFNATQPFNGATVASCP